MKSVKKRSIVVAGHKTSVSLEDCFWAALREIAKDKDMDLSEVAGAIDAKREGRNLSSSIRVFVFEHYRQQLALAAEHDRACMFAARDADEKAAGASV